MADASKWGMAREPEDSRKDVPNDDRSDKAEQSADDVSQECIEIDVHEESPSGPSVSVRIVNRESS
jgi:hypothetical protein